MLSVSTCPRCRDASRVTRTWSVFADIDIHCGGSHRGHLAPAINLVDHGYLDDRGQILWERCGEVSSVSCDAMTPSDEPIRDTGAPEAHPTTAEAMVGDVRTFCRSCGWSDDAAELAEPAP